MDNFPLKYLEQNLIYITFGYVEQLMQYMESRWFYYAAWKVLEAIFTDLEKSISKLVTNEVSKFFYRIRQSLEWFTADIFSTLFWKKAMRFWKLMVRMVGGIFWMCTSGAFLKYSAYIYTPEIILFWNQEKKGDNTKKKDHTCIEELQKVLNYSIMFEGSTVLKFRMPESSTFSMTLVQWHYWNQINVNFFPSSVLTSKHTTLLTVWNK